MKSHVYDTYVKAKDGHTMHFDVIMEEKDHKKALKYGKEWLKSIGEENASMTSEECKFCHIEETSDDVAKEITEKGYFILKLEGCQ